METFDLQFRKTYGSGISGRTNVRAKMNVTAKTTTMSYKFQTVLHYSKRSIHKMFCSRHGYVLYAVESSEQFIRMTISLGLIALLRITNLCFVINKNFKFQGGKHSILSEYHMDENR